MELQDLRRPTHLGLLAVAVLVTAIEMSATYSSLRGEPMTLVDEWTPARPGDAIALVLTGVGCGALFAIRRFPRTATVVAVASYGGFVWRDYDFGMTLPAMVAIFVLVAMEGRRLAATSAALACLLASLWWVSGRADSVSDSGIATLIWVAFGTVSTVFFLAPLLLGEIVRLRTALRATR